jgi:hypothetical protein
MGFLYPSAGHATLSLLLNLQVFFEIKLFYSMNRKIAEDNRRNNSRTDGRKGGLKGATSESILLEKFLKWLRSGFFTHE